MIKQRPIHNLPLQPTPFIGRVEDLAHLCEMLADPASRLVTLVGVGGIGKTRLATQAALEAQRHFPDGVYFVPLQSVSSVHFLPAAIADSLALPFHGQSDLVGQLLHYLQDKTLLLVLDNFEHLLGAGDLLTELLAAAPQLKLLATSREVLNLRLEWVYPMSGLRYPLSEDEGEPEDFGAVRLFVRCAQRIRPDFRLQDEYAGVARICQLVEGLPLALELAACWLKLLPCDAIADEIQRNLDFLNTNMRDIPDRHRNMRAVFDQSWTLLSEAEQAAFCRLSVFRGGFERAAAEVVAGATLVEFSGLLDKSLLRREADGRYQMHELLRQYAQEKLDEQGEAGREAAARHCAHYAALAVRHRWNLSNSAPSSAYVVVAQEMDNIRAAWEYALEQRDPALIDQFLITLYRIHDIQSRYTEGSLMFRQATDALGVSDDYTGDLTPVQSRACLLLGLCLQNMAHYDEALALVEASLPALKAHQAKWEIRNAEACLGNIAYSRSDYLRAHDHFDRVRVMLRESNEDAPAYVNLLVRLSDLSAVLGHFVEARALLQESLPLQEAFGSKQSRARLLLTMGDIECKLGNFDQAKSHFEAADALAQALEGPTTRAVALVSRGRAAFGIGDYEQARALCAESVALCETLHNLWGKAFALVHLGRACHELGVLNEARQHYYDGLTVCESIGGYWIMALTLRHLARLELKEGHQQAALAALAQALEIADKVQTLPLMLDVMGGVAEAALACGYNQHAHQLALYIAQHYASEYDSRVSAGAVLLEVKSGAPALLADMPLETLIPALRVTVQSRFETPLAPLPAEQPEVRAPETAHSSERTLDLEEGLLDVLSEREVEILGLLADGLTNQEIADKLFLVVGTVKAHNHNIFSKLGVRNRVEAIARAKALNLI